MEIVTDRTEYEILSILDRKNRAVDSAEIEKELKKAGIDISRRRINQYLEVLDEKGFTENLGRDGRRITSGGRREAGKRGECERQEHREFQEEDGAPGRKRSLLVGQ